MTVSIHIYSIMDLRCRGTTGTIMGVSRYLKGRNPDVQIVGLQPSEGASIAGASACRCLPCLGKRQQSLTYPLPCALKAACAYAQHTRIQLVLPHMILCNGHGWHTTAEFLRTVADVCLATFRTAAQQRLVVPHNVAALWHG